jgi:hypothetical protein
MQREGDSARLPLDVEIERLCEALVNAAADWWARRVTEEGVTLSRVIERELPSGGLESCPLTAIGSARWRPAELPTDCIFFVPVITSFLDVRGAEGTWDRGRRGKGAPPLSPVVVSQDGPLQGADR